MRGSRVLAISSLLVALAGAPSPAVAAGDPDMVAGYADGQQTVAAGPTENP